MDLHLTVDPNEAGVNRIHIAVTRPDGSPASLQKAVVWFEMPDRDIGPIRVEATKHGLGLFVVEGHQLSFAGDWIVGVRLTRADYTIEELEIEVPVRE